MKQVLILAGGRGSRLGNLTKTTPKPLLKFDGKNSTLSILVHKCFKENFEEIIILAGYLPEKMKNFFLELDSSIKSRVKVIYETDFLGTAGAINNALEYLDDKFLVLNGDTLLNINYSDFYDLSNMVKFQACLSLKKLESSSARYGTIEIDKDYITEFKEKEANQNKKFQYINLGCYMLTKNIFRKEDVGIEISLESDILPKVTAKKMVGYTLYNEDFIDIGTPESYLLAKKFSYDY